MSKYHIIIIIVGVVLEMHLIPPKLFSLLYFHEFFCTFVSRSVMRPSVVRSRQRCPRLGRKWSRRFLHLWSWCGLQVFKSAWPGPHLQSASGKFWRFFFHQGGHGQRTPNEAFFHRNPKLLCLGRQFGQINFGAIGVFSADLSASILVLWVPCPCFPLIKNCFYKKLSLYIHIFGIRIWFWSAKN